MRICTFVIIITLQVCGEGYEVPAGPGTDQRDGRTVSALWTLLPLTNVGQLHDSAAKTQIRKLKTFDGLLHTKANSRMA